MTSRNNHISALLACIILIMLASSSLADKARPFAIQADTWVSVDSLNFAEGDVLLRRGRSFVSSMIVKAFPDGEGMSHCGIVLHHDGRWQVLHSISGAISDEEGIRLESWLDFARQARGEEIRHVKPESDLDLDLLRQKALRYLALKTPFDHNFDLADDSSLYCSELVHSVYLAAGAEDIFLYKQVGTKRLIDMASFFNPEYWWEP